MRGSVRRRVRSPRVSAPAARRDRRARASTGRVAAVIAATILTALVPASCGSDHSIMHPRSEGARRVALLGWLMLAIAAFVFAVVVVLLIAGLFRPGGTTGPRRRFMMSERAWIAAGGLAFPVVVVIGLSALSVWVLATEQQTADTEIDVTGHQYWWEASYPGTTAVTANEIHIPSNTKVRIVLRTVDVIHSFWVPELGPKRDMVPGKVNQLLWKADHPGTYRGQCAEYCGPQHANMALIVVAQRPSDFRSWLDAQSADASAVDADSVGARLFGTLTCSGCHAVRGTAASGQLGPDLTHVASRSMLAAGTIPNDDEHLSRWIRNAPSMKPGALMPPVDLSPQDVEALVDYLRGLR